MRRALVTVLVVLLAAAAGVTGWLWTDRPADPTDRAPVLSDAGAYAVGSLPDGLDAAVEAAATTLPLALTYDYRTLDDGLERATAGMTDEFAEQFRTTFEGSAAELAADKKAVTNAVVRAAGLVRTEGGGRVLCLVYVDQVLVSSATMQDAERPVDVNQTRVLVGVTDVDGTWLVDSIQPF
ncbi:MAG: hypothetical protein F2667_14745 [Actinobacteria bacterium]|uniref:Unannotated protein n=1 Tax=freshwater metagenome TaxID=449393 RepID=A0A6J6SIK5_9ZZZZ|nr:hypothetical protein [Actinomycetota bacterium]